jgi:hypothetical protein
MTNNSKIETPQLVATGDLLAQRIVPLKRLALMFYGQIAIALIMGATGQVGRDTVIPACYFAVLGIVIGVICSEKKANIPQSATPGGQSPAQPHNPSPGVAL